MFPFMTKPLIAFNMPKVDKPCYVQFEKAPVVSWDRTTLEISSILT
jgi:hypothetical protein